MAAWMSAGAAPSRQVNTFEWMGERVSRDAAVPEDVRPASMGPLGTHAMSAMLRAPSRYQ